MNYLAHTFLSQGDEEVLIGNFIADFINAKQARMMDEPYQRGIELHRKIDSYTDKHLEFRKGTKRLSKYHSKYSPVVLDILYDHLLAVNWGQYAHVSLEIHAQNTYAIFENHMDAFLDQGVEHIPRMIEHDFLSSYADVDKVKYVLSRMDLRTRFASQFVNAMDHLHEDYGFYNAEFNLFLPDILKMVKEQAVKNSFLIVSK